jgi:hypothetical protein
VILGAAVFMVPMMALNLGLSALAFRDFNSLDSLFADRGYIGVETGAVLLAIVVESLTAHLIGAYAAVVLAGYQMGGEPRLGESVMTVLKRLPLLACTWLLTHWWAVLLAVWVVNQPQLTGGLAVVLGPLVALVTMWVLLTAPVMMVEGTGVGSIRRGFSLARTRSGASYSFVLASGLLGGVLFVFIAQLPYLIEQTGLVTFGRFGYLVQGVASQVALLVVLPFSALCAAQYYLQLRVHAEGIDIVLAADRAFGTAA